LLKFAVHFFFRPKPKFYLKFMIQSKSFNYLQCINLLTVKKIQISVYFNHYKVL